MQAKEPRIFNAHAMVVSGLLFWNDHLISTGADSLRGDYKGEIKIWNWKEGLLVHSWRLENHQAGRPVLMPDGNHMATAGGEGIVRFWELETRENTISFVGHEGGISSILLSKNGRALISGGGKLRTSQQKGHGEIRFWDVVQTKLLAKLELSEQINAMVVSPDQQWLYAGASKDIIVWKLKSKAQ
jgi:WD40 repeat protein